MGTMAERGTVAFLSSFVPRECGVGTFTRDLSTGVDQARPERPSVVVAINDPDGEYDYARKVVFEVDQGLTETYVEAARYLNKQSRVKVVSVQHEFGLYGELRDGAVTQDHLVPFLQELKKPSCVTMHTVLPHPGDNLRQKVREIYDNSDASVVMVNMAAIIMAEDYGLAEHGAEGEYQPPRKLHAIPHGVPNIALPKRDGHVRRNMHSEAILSTFGLLSPGKGLEYVIKAMPMILEQHPQTMYLILGATHPDLRRHQGETYRNYLLELVHDLKLEKHVRFNNRFLPQTELVQYLKATDIYVTPYLNRNQITSGTLAYALGCGKAIISTPYLYAQEALAEGRGMLAEFRSPESIANCVNQILGTPGLKEHLQAQSSAYGAEMSWRRVAERYLELFDELAA
ncbi:MAG: glycosyltransferase family 4 protein [Chloroflexota bacterium]